MADGKWIEGLEPGMAVADATRRVLAERFEIVCRYLPLAMHQPDADSEHVHRLRVGTRRAGAALRIFRAWLPDRARRRARRALRDLRRAAGDARDWDVFLLGLLTPGKKVPEKARPGMDFLAGYAAGQRDAAQ